MKEMKEMKEVKEVKEEAPSPKIVGEKNICFA